MRSVFGSVGESNSWNSFCSWREVVVWWCLIEKRKTTLNIRYVDWKRSATAT